jgi:alpha/beta hydrolase fold
MTAGADRLPAASDPRLGGSYVEVPGGRLWTEQAGSGPAVLFAHAGIAGRQMWDQQMTALAGRYHLIRYDQRGFGKSAPPDVPYSPAADLGAVLDHAGVDRAALVGLLDRRRGRAAVPAGASRAGDRANPGRGQHVRAAVRASAGVLRRARDRGSGTDSRRDDPGSGLRAVRPGR